MDTLTKQRIVTSISMGIPENYAVLRVGIVISCYCALLVEGKRKKKSEDR